MREVEVLQLVARGLTDQHMGKELLVSVLTVAAHMKNICAKLGLAGRHEVGEAQWLELN